MACIQVNKPLNSYPHEKHMCICFNPLQSPFPIFVFSGVNFPPQMKDIAKFEQLNSIRINIFRFNRQSKKKKWSKAFPVRISSKHYKETMNLIQLKCEISDNQHFILVKSLALLASNNSKWRSRVRVCERCLQMRQVKADTAHPSEFNDHIRLCSDKPIQRTIMPSPSNNKLEYGTDDAPVTHFESDLDFFCVADLETEIHPITKKHVVNSAAYKLLSRDESFYSPPKVFVGFECNPQFLDSLQNEQMHLKEILKNKAPLNVSDQELEFLNSSCICHLCKKEIGEEQVRVVDHCHLRGDIRGKYEDIVSFHLPFYTSEFSFIVKSC